MKPIGLLAIALLIAVLIPLNDQPEGLLFWAGIGTFFVLVVAAIVTMAGEAPYGRD